MACTPRYQRFQAELVGPFDTVTVFIAYATTEAEFNYYAEIIFERLETLHRLYDIYQAYDGLNNLHTINSQAGIAPVEVAPEIITMLLAAQEAYDLTAGRTNIALGPVLQIWHQYRTTALTSPENATLPSLAYLQEAAIWVDIADLVIDEDKHTVYLRQAAMRLDAGSVAKGYAAGLALAAAIEAGLETALLNVGGHVLAIGAPPGREHWHIAVQNPQAGLPGEPAAIGTLALTNTTVSVSGAYQRFFMVGGQSFGHLIDPDSLFPAELYQQVTVVHPQSWLADVLATALFILPLAEGQALAATHDAEALWIDYDGNWFATPGLAFSH